MPLTLDPPPPTPVEPVTEVLHGVTVTDPYRWLEDQNSPHTRQWLEEQTVYSRAYLKSIPGRERIRKRVEDLLATEVISEPQQIGERFFFLKRTSHQEQPVIAMREGKAGEDIVLIDPAERSEGPTTAVRVLTISNDGQLLAYAVRRGGEDACAVEFFDIERRQVLSDALPHGFCDGLVFAQGRQGFYYSHVPVTAEHPYYRAVYWHTFGTKPDQDREIFFCGDNPKLRLQVLGSPDAQRLVYSAIYLHDPPATDIYIHDLTDDKSPRRIFKQMKGTFSPFFIGNQLIAVSNWKAPNCRVLAIDLDKPDNSGWREIVPESTRRIRSVAIVGGQILVSYVDNAAVQTEIFDLFGQRLGMLPHPSNGTTRFVSWRPEEDTLFYQFTSYSQPPEILMYHASTGKSEVWNQSTIPFDPASIEVRQVMFPSKDGTKIPMFLVAKVGHQDSGPRPTFLTGYGGFGVSVTPQFAVYSTVLIEQGFLFAVANLRGGAEFGQDWHDAGRRHKRQNAIDDFISAAEWLQTNGHAAHGRLAIGGGSNAGLLVGAAMTQRPDLFRAVICLGPLLDMLRYHKFDWGDRWIEELGAAENAEDFPFLKAYSPYHRVQEGTAYPAVMLISGDADTRCNPLHARKMVAKLQAATTSPHPIVLDYKPAWGHMPTQPLTARIDALTDRLAFLCQELGVTV